MPDVRLTGCGTKPLLSYLKALGILRVVSEQGDREARGRWRDCVFELRSALSDDELVEFMLDRYEPAPVVSPWNGGSGFHPNDRKQAIETLESSDDPRFDQYRETIAAARRALARIGLEDKPDAATKLRLVRDMRRSAPDAALDWLDAAVVVVGDATAYPPLLGSGGNDGRYDFSNNFAQAIVACLIEAQSKPTATAALGGALFGGEVDLQRKLSLGHLSRDASPTNSPQGEADSLGNPWDLILGVEGSLLLVAGAARRHGTSTRRTLVAPFTARPTAAGYGSAAPDESGRAELWLPLWPAWAARAEVAALARESRAQVRTGAAVRTARTGLDFARAAGELGVARGIEAFERYAILERAGQSSLAVPAGRVSVAARPRAAALRELDPWLNRVLGRAADDDCPRAARTAIRRAESAAFQLAIRDDSESCADLIVALGALEGQLARSADWAIAKDISPVHGLSASTWLQAANDESAEFAVAAALASLRSHRGATPSLRDYLHGTTLADNGVVRREFDQRRAHAVFGNRPTELLAQIHVHRHRDAERNAGGDDGRHPDLPFDLGTWAHLDAARMFAAGLLDDEKVLRLVRGLSLLVYRDRRAASLERPKDSHPTGVPAFDLLAIAWAPQAPSEDAEPDAGSAHPSPRTAIRAPLGARPGWAAALAMGATSAVIRDAGLRLQMAGRPPLLHHDDLLAGAPRGDRLAAALLLHFGPRDRERLTRQLTTWPDDRLNAQRTETEE